MAEAARTSDDYAEEARRFFSIQIARYLDGRPSGRFSGAPERDVVTAIIKDAWIELRSSGALDGLNSRGREAVYWTTLIVFPSFVADAGLNCIPVDFIGRRRVGEQIIAAPVRPSLNL